MSPGNKALVGLAGGLVSGAAIAAAKSPPLLAAGSAVELLGRLWINAILMTILPLVVSKLIVSVAGSDDARGIGQAGWRACALFAVLLCAGATLTAVLMPALFAYLPIDPAASAALRASVAGPLAATGAAPPTAAQWLLGLVPTNPIRAAADGAMLPLIVFSLAFALAATRIEESLRGSLVGFFRAIDAAITVLLQWIVALSPLGVFALALGLAMQVGLSIVSALGYYVLVSSLSLVAFSLALYVVVAFGARISPSRFGRACAPAQVVAFGTHSSAASLPAMLEGGAALGLSRTALGFVLPLSLAMFKYSAPIWFLVVVSFVARLYDVAIDPSRVVPTVLMAVVTSFAVGGVPSGAAVVVAPVLLTAGLPAEAMGILLAVDPIPNGFRTAANVTGMLAVTALTGRAASPDESR